MENAQLAEIISELKAIHALLSNGNGPAPEGKRAMQFTKAICGVCSADMELKQLMSKRTGKPYTAWTCPNSSKENPHPLIFPNSLNGN